MSAEVVRAKSRLGVVTRRGNAQQIQEARRDFAAAKLAAYVEKVVAEAPPLSQDQADRIAALLRPAADRAGAA